MAIRDIVSKNEERNQSNFQAYCPNVAELQRDEQVQFFAEFVSNFLSEYWFKLLCNNTTFVNSD